MLHSTPSLSIPFHSTTLQYTSTTTTPTTATSTTLHSTTLHYIELRYTTLHYTAPHCTPPTSTTASTTTTKTIRSTELHYATHPTLYTPHHTTLQLQLQLQLQLGHFTLHYTRLHRTTLQYIARHSLHHHIYNCNYTTLITLYTPQLQLHCSATTTTAAVRHTTSSSCEWGDHCNQCNYSKNHYSNHLSAHQWIHSAICGSQQPNSPIGLVFWNFRHRLVQYHWYIRDSNLLLA